MKVGIDIEQVSRMSEALAEKIATESEKKYLSQFKTNQSQHIGSLWTAKEACVKMLGKTDLSFLEIEINHSNGGRPSLSLSGKALVEFERLGLNGIDLSISHSGDIVTAIVIGY